MLESNTTINASLKHFKLSYDPSDQPFNLTILTYIYIPLHIVFSCYGNTCLLVMTRKQGNFWHPINLLITNVTISNLVITIIPSTSNLVETILKKWVFGSVFCNISVSLQYYCISISHFSLLVIAVERYLAISKPFKFRRRPTYDLKLTMMVVLVAAMGVALAVIFVNHPNVQFKSGEEGCINNWIHMPRKKQDVKKHAILALLLFTVLYIIPKCGMIIIYTRLAIKLWKRKIPGEQRPNAFIEIERKRKKRTTLMFLCTILLFLVAWLPTWIQQFMLLADFGSEVSGSKTYLIDSIVTTIAFSHCAFSPWIFIIFVRKYRNNFKKHFRWLRHKFTRKTNLIKSVATTDSQHTTQF